ncbi:MAG TPA: hypothetical protein VHM90_16630 [Phycisphaerae bacterium]|nr:hypothetical protein [Phycisphaerae bacterium]
MSSELELAGRAGVVLEWKLAEFGKRYLTLPQIAEVMAAFASAEIEKAVAQAVEARTREIVDYLYQIAATWQDANQSFAVKDAARDVLEHFNLQPKAECSGTVECFTCHSPIACDGRHTEKQYCSQLCEIMDCQSPHHPGCNKCEVQPKAEDGGGSGL